MIDINLLPPRPRPVWSTLLLPVLLLLAGAALAIYLAAGYIELRQSVSTMRADIEATERRQAELQLEIQQLSKTYGIGVDGKELLQSLRRLRPRLEPLMRDLQAPLPEGGQIEDIQFGLRSLVWTCSFQSLNEVRDYSKSMQQVFAAGEVFIQTIHEQEEQYVGTFQLLGEDIAGIISRGQAGEAG
ncbi:hypothetical protein [Paenibacillus aceti]|uniref:Fimbrial assembly protein n=1 Tax=Paenibacillus aceti TaxID=1820010 RepID=A0ABQ1VYE7_9BACL|nr:hypothetical protein [Paenibacillus aceti]GGG04615.1 hypothetical protein GCM10010913_28050 [Paenibacillus aceti]